MTYKDILSVLEQRRTRAEYESARLANEIAEKNPELKTIQTAIADAAMVLFQDQVRGMDPDAAEQKYKLTVATLSEKRNALLQSAGYTEADLKPQYQCNDCHDTGFLNDQKCHCLKRMISEAYMARFNLADGIRGQPFETFDEKIFSKEDQAYAALYRKLGKKICDEIDQNDENYIFIGEPGRGKTFRWSKHPN